MCDLLGRAFFTQHNSVEIHQVVVCIDSSILFMGEYHSMMWVDHR